MGQLLRNMLISRLQHYHHMFDQSKYHCLARDGSIYTDTIALSTRDIPVSFA